MKGDSLGSPHQSRLSSQAFILNLVLLIDWWERPARTRRGRLPVRGSSFGWWWQIGCSTAGHAHVPPAWEDGSEIEDSLRGAMLCV